MTLLMFFDWARVVAKKKHSLDHQVVMNIQLYVSCFASHVSASLGKNFYRGDSTRQNAMHVLRAWASRMGQRHLQWTWALKRGLDSDLLTKYYMITKKLTFNIHFQSTKKIFPNQAMVPKVVSNIENAIRFDGFHVIGQNIEAFLSLAAQQLPSQNIPALSINNTSYLIN